MSLYIYALAAAAILLVTHMLGLQGLYWAIPVYDIFMHVLGGAGIALLLSAFIRSVKPGAAHPRRAVIIGTLAIGLLWEVFEGYFGLLGFPLWSQPYFIDTTADLINDVIGAAAVAFISFRPRT